MTTIAQERAALAAVGFRLRRREEWGAARSYTDSRPVTEPAAYQFVHITITNPGSYRSDDAHARAIEQIGISRFPNTGISYNRLLFQSGGAYEGQPIGRRGAHTVNDDQRATCGTAGCPTRGGSVAAPSFNLNLNARAYVICQNIGDVITAKQLESLARIMAADRLAGFVRRTAGIHGHRCVSSKSCPGDKMWALMQTLENKINHYLANGLNPPEDDMNAEQDRRLKVIEDHVTAITYRVDAMLRMLPEANFTVPSNDTPRTETNILAQELHAIHDAVGPPTP